MSKETHMQVLKAIKKMVLRAIGYSAEFEVDDFEPIKIKRRWSI